MPSPAAGAVLWRAAIAAVARPTAAMISTVEVATVRGVEGDLGIWNRLRFTCTQ